jgi:hypothetical protein
MSISGNALGERSEQVHSRGVEKGPLMALDTNTFLIVFAAASVVFGLFVWVTYKRGS